MISMVQTSIVILQDQKIFHTLLNTVIIYDNI